MLLCVYREPHVLLGNENESTKEVSVAECLESLVSQWCKRSDNQDTAEPCKW